MLALTPAVLNLVAQGLPVAIQVGQAAVTEYELYKSGTAPSAEQQAAIDAALDAANAALMAAQPG